jgi:hypothetical protein
MKTQFYKMKIMLTMQKLLEGQEKWMKEGLTYLVNGFRRGMSYCGDYWWPRQWLAGVGKIFWVVFSI